MSTTLLSTSPVVAAGGAPTSGYGSAIDCTTTGLARIAATVTPTFPAGHAGGHCAVDLQIETGPTSTGPWQALGDAVQIRSGAYARRFTRPGLDVYARVAWTASGPVGATIAIAVTGDLL